jgi:Ca-activated chloride channel family protein
MLSFEYPWAALLLPLPLLVWLLWPRATRSEAVVRVPFFEQLLEEGAQSAAGHRPPLWRALPLVLWWLLLVAAACGPRWVGDAIALPASGRDLLLAVDISGSMQIEDMVIGSERVQRLVAVKAVVDDFIRQRRGDRIGLILFGTQAYLQAPLTFDRDTVARLLREAQIGFAGEETAIGDAIGLAIKRLRERPGERHVLILLTDGANTAGSVEPVEAAAMAARHNITIYTVGVGADELMLPGLFGSQFGARRVNPSADLDEKSLRTIADSTGGRYFRARDPAELATIYQTLDQLEPVAGPAESYRPERSLFHWPLGAALLLSFAAALASAWPRRGTGRSQSWSG